ncbi:unnamed protein product, partial [Urochloa humidicola]
RGCEGDGGSAIQAVTTATQGSFRRRPPSSLATFSPMQELLITNGCRSFKSDLQLPLKYPASYGVNTQRASCSLVDCRWHLKWLDDYVNDVTATALVALI